MINHSLKNNRAFTLVEMIVALGLFAVVATVALGALVKIISVNKKAQTLHQSMTNINFALESMSRELRVGTMYNCTTGAGILSSISLTSGLACTSMISNQSAYLAFNSSQKDPSPTASCQRLINSYRFVSYSLGSISAYHIEKAEQVACGDRVTNDMYAPVLDPGVIITDYTIGVTNKAYPLVFIKISGYVGAKEKERTYFDLQTAVSPRTIN